jgi:hypothetical protein
MKKPIEFNELEFKSMGGSKSFDVYIGDTFIGCAIFGEIRKYGKMKGETYGCGSDFLDLPFMIVGGRKTAQNRFTKAYERLLKVIVKG